ncbi:MAG TPA: hypothetical protein VK249_06420 [Anaerolineales bacterium]|nr:hypothetical protein [Anaerolineales bacterium]
MSTGKGQVVELILEDGCRHVRVSCPPNLIPSPGQYLLAGDTSDVPLPVPLFYTDSVPQGVTVGSWGHFIGAAQIPDSWHPGLELYLRGPLGRGFTLPLSARRVGLIALDTSPARLKGLIRPALKQDAAVVLVGHSSPENLPDDVEVHPFSSLYEILEWADYVACDVAREDLPQLREQLGRLNQPPVGKARPELSRNEAQILVHTPVPCGGIADCGVCAVSLKSDWKLACKDGPVFDWSDIFR